jgi:hypothetical protein
MLGPTVGLGGMTKRNTLSQLEIELRSPIPHLVLFCLTAIIAYYRFVLVVRGRAS